jgi:hypothetical protein
VVEALLATVSPVKVDEMPVTIDPRLGLSISPEEEGIVLFQPPDPEPG